MASGTIEYLYGVWGSNGDDVFAVGRNGTILRYDGSSWAYMTSGTTEADHSQNRRVEFQMLVRRQAAY